MSTNSVTELTAERFDVRSTDGIPIALRVDGTGPALVRRMMGSPDGRDIDMTAQEGSPDAADRTL